MVGVDGLEQARRCAVIGLDVGAAALIPGGGEHDLLRNRSARLSKKLRSVGDAGGETAMSCSPLMVETELPVY